MGKIVVEVMVKPEILDPQGKAIKGSLARLGIDNFVDVRQGKRFTLDTAGDVTEADLEAARQAAQTLLSNPIIEDVVAVKAVTEAQA
ncbi:phosphoribosylformylglycinamidine synthase subunit PurS [uncultured Mobiluncus sp.]|uniref:phosphoribosylformylglycinamidine synthase subunit PurS n=1 Tax=uncultured Mobiluncus sp. TaxID=293425 RepID=UPI002629FE3D|nr:phosphoribosylformylglycinamidine synthase subunit PurS [uncultured Mobiluncus sp.]